MRYKTKFTNNNVNLVLLHTSLATLHPYRICLDDSQPPHRSHTSSFPLPLARNLCLVGSIFEHALHINILTLFGQFKPQICFQGLFIPAVSEHSPPSNLGYAFRNKDWATLYALLTVNIPLGVHAHIRESLGSRGLKGMPRITLASWGRNILLIFATSQLHLSMFISSTTISASG